MINVPTTEGELNKKAHSTNVLTKVLNPGLAASHKGEQLEDDFWEV